MKIEIKGKIREEMSQMKMEIKGEIREEMSQMKLEIKGEIREEMSLIKQEIKEEIKEMLENFFVNQRKCSDLSTNVVPKESRTINSIEE
jgi:gas vesicle protein